VSLWDYLPETNKRVRVVVVWEPDTKNKRATRTLSLNYEVFCVFVCMGVYVLVFVCVCVCVCASDQGAVGTDSVREEREIVFERECV
jgi:hypothetical protein